MRLVIKIGTSTLAHPTGHLNIRLVEQLCKVVSDIKNAGHQVILVSSGAIGMGVGKLGLRERPRDIPGKQAAAAVGQCELMYTYDKLFGEYNHTVGQLLISAGRISAIPLPGCWNWEPSPSSMKMTPLPPRKSSSATTTIWRRLWRNVWMRSF